MKRVPPCYDNYPDQLPNTYFHTPEDIAYFPYNPMTFKKQKLIPQKRDPKELDYQINM